MLSGHLFPLLLDAVPVGSKRRAYERWAVELSDGSSIRVRPPNLALLSRDDCPPSLQCGALGSRSGRGSWRRGAGRAEFAGRRTENVHVSGAFFQTVGGQYQQRWACVNSLCFVPRPKKQMERSRPLLLRRGWLVHRRHYRQPATRHKTSTRRRSKCTPSHSKSRPRSMVATPDSRDEPPKCNQELRKQWYCVPSAGTAVRKFQLGQTDGCLSPLVPARATWPNGKWGYSTRCHMLGPGAQTRCYPTALSLCLLTASHSLIDSKLLSLAPPPPPPHASHETSLPPTHPPLGVCIEC